MFQDFTKTKNFNIHLDISTTPKPTMENRFVFKQVAFQTSVTNEGARLGSQLPNLASNMEHMSKHPPYNPAAKKLNIAYLCEWYWYPPWN